MTFSRHGIGMSVEARSKRVGSHTLPAHPPRPRDKPVLLVRDRAEARDPPERDERESDREQKHRDRHALKNSLRGVPRSWST